MLVRGALRMWLLAHGELLERSCDWRQVGGCTPSRAATEELAPDPLLLGMKCDFASLLRASVEANDLHSMNVDATGTYSYEVLTDEDLRHFPEYSHAAVHDACARLKELYVDALAHVLRRRALCPLGEARCPSRPPLIAPATAAGDGFAAEVAARHTAAAAAEAAADDAEAAARRLAFRLIFFADELAIRTVMHAMPTFNPDHAGYQQLVRLVSPPPRVEYADFVGPRWEVVSRLVSEIGARRVAEVGVEKGLTARFLLEQHPGIDYVGVDPYFMAGKGELNTVLDGYHSNLSAWMQERYPASRLIRATGDEAVSAFPDGHFDLVFIDADHDFLPVRNDVRQWTRKVRSGGLVVGHDFSPFHLTVVLAVLLECRDSLRPPVRLGMDTVWWCSVP